MATSQNHSAHRHWEDWCSLGLGAMILFSPVIAHTVAWPYVTLNAVLVGALVMLLAWQELMLLEIWEEYLEVALGLWIAASPFMFGYSNQGLATATHITLGGAVTVLALVEFCQDRWPTQHPV